MLTPENVDTPEGKAELERLAEKDAARAALIRRFMREDIKKGGFSPTAGREKSKPAAMPPPESIRPDKKQLGGNDRLED